MYSHAHEAAEAWDDYAVEHNLGLASYNKGPRREASFSYVIMTEYLTIIILLIIDYYVL